MVRKGVRQSDRAFVWIIVVILMALAGLAAGGCERFTTPPETPPTSLTLPAPTDAAAPATGTPIPFA